MADLDDLVEGILEREGGLVEHPADPGGLTNFGLTLPFLSDLLGRPVTREELKGLTRAQAGAYYQQWIRKTKMDQISVDILRLHVVDYAVNSGVGVAVKALQYALGVTPDGVIGVETLGAVAKANVAETLSKLIGRRLRLLAGLLDTPSGPVFIKGWLKRISALMVGRNS